MGVWICLGIVTLILGLGLGAQCLIQTLGLCWHPWPWAIYKVHVRSSPPSLQSLTLSLCQEWHSAHVQVVIDQGMGGHGYNQGSHLTLDTSVSYQESSWRS